MEVTSGKSPFQKLIGNNLKFSLYLLKNLPAAWFSGVRLRHISSNSSIVSVPYRWFTRNPFRSTYFACLSMAAEMSTGVLAMQEVYDYKGKVALLVVGVEGKFFKKAKETVWFECTQGTTFKNAVATALKSGDAKKVVAFSSGKNKKGEIVAEFLVTWSFKARSSLNQDLENQ